MFIIYADGGKDYESGYYCGTYRYQLDNFIGCAREKMNQI